jgi:hypothetical protein
VISTCAPLEIPVVTTRCDVAPFAETVTVEVPPDRLIALLGTARTFGYDL